MGKIDYITLNNLQLYDKDHAGVILFGFENLFPEMDYRVLSPLTSFSPEPLSVQNLS
jgi:hypothetical protein